MVKLWFPYWLIKHSSYEVMICAKIIIPGSPLRSAWINWSTPPMRLPSPQSPPTSPSTHHSAPGPQTRHRTPTPPLVIHSFSKILYSSEDLGYLIPFYLRPLSLRCLCLLLFHTEHENGLVTCNALLPSSSSSSLSSETRASPTKGISPALVC